MAKRSRASGNGMATLLRSDKRSAHPITGDAPAVAARVLRQPELLRELVECLFDDDSSARARATSALGEIARQRIDLLQPHKDVLIAVIEELDQWSVRYKLCLILPRLRLTRQEVAGLFELFQSFLSDRSSALKASALQGLAELAFLDTSLNEEAIWVIERQMRDGTPAMRARGRRVLKQLYDLSSEFTGGFTGRMKSNP